MMQWLDWLKTNWTWIAGAAVLIASVANLITSHYGETNPRLKKALLFVVDLLSILVSRGSTAGPGRAGGLSALKLPIVQTSPPPAPKASNWVPGSIISKAGLILVLVLAVLAGCGAGNMRATLVAGSDAVKNVRVKVLPKACDLVERECTTSPCAALEQCHKTERGMSLATKLWLHHARGLNRLLPKE